MSREQAFQRRKHDAAQLRPKRPPARHARSPLSQPATTNRETDPASNSTKHTSPQLSAWRQILALITLVTDLNEPHLVPLRQQRDLNVAKTHVDRFGASRQVVAEGSVGGALQV